MNSLLATVEKYKMLAPGDAVLCALSSGADSTCMTHALAGVGGRLGITLAAAHFSHGIRPDAAARERGLAQELCNSLGIELFCGQADTPAYARERGIGLEQAARELRYSFLRETLTLWAGQGRGKIAVAHNLGDQAETVLFNLTRGAGLKGLKGISPVAGDIIRPLVETPRAEIEEYLKAHSLSFAIDETNTDNTYSRNSIRNEIMPLLAKINSRSEQNIARAGFFSLEALDFLDAQAEALILKRDDSAATLDANALVAAHPALAARAALLAYESVRQGVGLAHTHVQAVLALAAGKGPSASLDLPAGICARREYNLLIFDSCAAAPSAPGEAIVGLGEAVLWGDWRIEISGNPLPGARAICKSEAHMPVTVRARRQGDSILTTAGEKSIKKLMIDLKIPKNIRDITPVLCDNIGVLCVGGTVWRSGVVCAERVKSRDEKIYISVGKAGERA